MEVREVIANPSVGGTQGGGGYYITDATVEAQMGEYPTGPIEPGSLVLFDYYWVGVVVGGQAPIITVEGYNYRLTPTAYHSGGIPEPGHQHFAFYMPAANVSTGDYG